jgi:hypothetical protein
MPVELEDRVALAVGERGGDAGGELPLAQRVARLDDARQVIKPVGALRRDRVERAEQREQQ